MLRQEKQANIDDFKRNVQRCSHIALMRENLSYSHHMLVSEVSSNAIEVIEYGSPVGLTSTISAALAKYVGKIHEKKITFDELFDPDASAVFLVYSEDYPRTDEEKNAAMQRAKSRKGETRYCLTYNNCEHFVTWALTGKPISFQWRNATTARRFEGDFLTMLISEVWNIVHLLLKRCLPKVELEILAKSVSFLKDKILQNLPENRVFENFETHVSSIKDVDVLLAILYSLSEIVFHLVICEPSLSEKVCEFTENIVRRIYSLLGYKLQLLEIAERLYLWRRDLISTVDLLREIIKFGVLLVLSIYFPDSVQFLRQILGYPLIRAVASSVGGCIFDKVFSFIRA